MLNFVTNTSIASASTSASSDQEALDAMTPLERVQHFLTLDRYNCNALIAAVKVHEEGPFKGKAVLSLEPEQILGREPGFFRLSLAFAEANAAGVPLVKVAVSYINKDGKAVLLTRGGYDDANANSWVGISTNPVPLSGLFDGGFIAAEAQESVWKWWQANNGLKTSAPLVIKSTLTAVLRVTQMSDKAVEDQAAKGREAKGASHRPGDWVNLGIDALGFAGAELLPMQSSLIGVEAGQGATIAELQARFGGGVAGLITNDAGL